MKQARYDNTPVPIPTGNVGISNVGSWAYQIRRALEALRDRKVLVPSNTPPALSHPWKVTANGDDTVKVADGSVIYFTSQGSSSVTNAPFDGEKIDYTSDDVTITASGTLYVVLTSSGVYLDEIISLESTSGVGAQAFTPSSIAVELDPTLTGDKLSIPIASVTLTSGVASVDTQILTYNPILDLTYVDVAASP